MTVRELYRLLEDRIPESLREDWDNDGLMLSPDLDRRVSRILCALDLSEAVADYAAEHGYQLVVTHHPLIFRPITHFHEENAVSRKALTLLFGGVSVFSFHTRLDRVDGGVNDALAKSLGLYDVMPFGENGMGRIGFLPSEMSLPEFAEYVKFALHSDCISVSGNRKVSRVAVLGGDGKDFVSAAKNAGADTYLSGHIGYNVMLEATENRMNLCEAGHFFTENPVLASLREMLLSIDSDCTVDLYDSNEITVFH